MPPNLPRRRNGLALLLSVSLLALVAAGTPSDAGSAARVAPNDPLYALDQGYLAAIHAPEAWNVQRGDPGIVVAVLDDGVELEHPDLTANIWTNPAPGGCGQDLHGCNFLPADFGTYGCGVTAPAGTPDVSPTGWHGTFAAGVIGAVGDNGEGIAGIAWRVAIMPVRVADCRGEADTTATANAIHYAVDRGARVIYLGVGRSRTTPGGCRAPNRFLGDAVQYARDHDALVVTATGNSNVDCVDDPAADPGALAVAGSAQPGDGRWLTGRTRGSNWGPEVAVAAPAADIVGTVPRGTDAKRPDDRYARSSGTSFAAAIVAGEAALLLAQNPLLTPDWLATLIEKGARAPSGEPLGWAGAGTVDLAASLGLVPAGFTGAARLDGAPTPGGTPVEAYVGGALCAQTTTFSTDGDASYLLFVPAATMQPGCGAPGAPVELRLNGETVAAMPWSPAAILLDLDASTGG